MATIKKKIKTKERHKIELNHDIRLELQHNPEDKDEMNMHVYGNDGRLLAMAVFTISDWIYFTAAVAEVEKELLRMGLSKEMMSKV